MQYRHRLNNPLGQAVVNELEIGRASILRPHDPRWYPNNMFIRPHLQFRRSGLFGDGEARREVVQIILGQSAALKISVNT